MALERNSLFLDGDWIESKDISSDGIRYITTGNVGEGAYKEQGAGFISEETFHALGCTEVYEGDILVSRLNNPIGRACVVPDLGGRVVTSVDNVIFRPDSKFDKKFIVYLFSSEEYFKHTSNLARGATMQRISRGLLGNIRVVAPLFEEQTQIARFLDHETARIDALIEEQQRLIELLKEKRQAVISHAVTKGLDPTVPMKDSGVEWLGEVPAHWVCKSYRYASIIYRGKFSHRPRNDPSLYDGDFAFIQTGDIARAEKYIVEYKQTLNEKGASVSQKFPSGTLVMAIAANVGDTAILGFEAYAPDSVVGFKPERDIELEFLRFSLMAALQELKKTSTQSTQANLNIDRISGIKSVFPPLAEQSAITVYLNEVMERFSLLEKQAEASIELMNERRSALISAAVTGKIDVRGWRPPARTQAPKFEVAEAV
jgi:type I restriction enzyme S subunit